MFLLWSTFLISSSSLANLQIETNIENAVQTIKKIIITTDGTKDPGNEKVIIDWSQATAKVQVVGDITAGEDTNAITAGDYSFIWGGKNNTIDGNHSTIVAGEGNSIVWSRNSIGGGKTNRIIWQESTIPGGSNNIATGNFNFAAGKKTRINGKNSVFIRGDGSEEFEATNHAQFLVKASNGVGINTNEPLTALHVNGDVSAIRYCDENGENCQEISASTWVRTSATYNWAEIGGYYGANAKCDAFLTDSHICATSEILSLVRKNLASTNTNVKWRISNWPPGYVAKANDCQGYTDALSTTYGARWQFDANWGQWKLNTCNAKLPILCCK